jgi:acyl-CoA thioesterase
VSDLPAVLQLQDKGSGLWVAPHPETDQEGWDVVFGGQLLGQMIMAASDGDKQVKSIHAVFARAGRYSAGPLDLEVESMHAGRAWASSTVTASQGDKLLSRALVLANTVEPDLIRHAPAMPDVPGPEDCAAGTAGAVFPGAETRVVAATEAAVEYVWVRGATSVDSVAANQAILAWCQPGFIIGAAFRPHADVVDLRDAHRSISTGVISHTTHFHEDADTSQWLLMVHEGSYAGRGRIFGTGSVFTRDGVLVSTFAQDSMARRAEASPM